MNEEIRNNELREDELEKVNGGTNFTKLPEPDINKVEQWNKERRENPKKLNHDEPESVAGGNGVTAILNPFDQY